MCTINISTYLAGIFIWLYKIASAFAMLQIDLKSNIDKYFMGGNMKIHIENFKGLKDVVINLGNFNVLIGANGSGKTSVLELFKFMNLCTDPDRTPAHPFAHWWGFGNIVWSRNERLPISVHVVYEVGGYDVEYKAVISGTGGSLEFKEERLSISNYLDIKRKICHVEYALDEKFKNKHKDILSKSNYNYESKLATFLDDGAVTRLSKSTSILSIVSGIRYFSDELGLITLLFPDADDEPELYIMSPIVGDDGELLYLKTSTLFESHYSNAANQGLILLRNLNYDMLHQPAQTNNPTLLQENGEGLINMLFQWKLSGSWPFRIERALQELFPGWSIGFKLTDDGRILLRVDDGTNLLSPPSIPDGFYKLLAILAAVEMEPRFLLIDELESSLHARIIEYVLDELRTCNATVVVTTHSPAVIDLAALEDLILLEQSGNEAICRKIDDPDKLNRVLHDEGLTMSEKWVYGHI